MPKKKQPYVFFCMEQKQMNQDKYSDKSLPEMIDLCSTAWEGMTFDERQPYIQMAQDQDNFAVNTVPSNGDLTGRFDSFGRSLLALEKERVTKESDLALMNKDIEYRVNSAVEKDVLPDVRFHILHCNVWVRTSEHEVYPAEIGFVEMSLREGIVNIFNQMVDPGSPPLGYKGEMKLMSDKYHGIWLDNKELSNNYVGIVEKIQSLLEPKGDEVPAGKDVNPDSPYSFLPLYVMPDNREDCRKSLEWLSRRTGINLSDIALYDLPRLFWTLTSLAPLELDRKVESLTIAEAHLNRDVFLFTPGVSCEFHEEIENSRCAGAEASRRAYIICDFCCQLYDIEPMEGMHIPYGVRLDELDSTTHSDVSSVGAFSMASQALEFGFHPPRGTTSSEIEMVRDIEFHPLSYFFDDAGNVLSIEELLRRRKMGELKPGKPVAVPQE